MAEVIYSEEIRSNKTDLLFVVLALIFYALGAWRVSVVGFKFLSALFVFLGLFFTLYVVNYRVLKISITDQGIQLKFGLIKWKTDYDNIQACLVDDSPPLIKYGGAGVHFAFVQGEYRAFYNFLEYSRVLIRFNKKQGLVQALVFTTRQPDRVMNIIKEHLPRS